MMSSSPSIHGRVQTLAAAESGHLCQFPSQYIQPIQNRPKRETKPSSSSPASIPILDLSEPSNLRSLCREWGAFHVVNHGVPAELLHEMRLVGLQFFANSPAEEKMRYACDPSSAASEGFGSRMLVAKEDQVLDWRDYFDHHTLPESRRNPSRWPNFPDNYRSIPTRRIDTSAERRLTPLQNEDYHRIFPYPPIQQTKKTTHLIPLSIFILRTMQYMHVPFSHVFFLIIL